MWRLSSRTESLMLAPESSRSPGSAFVEEDGATGALAQAMLSVVFRMVRLGHERGLLIEPSGATIDPIDHCERRKGHHAGGEGAVLQSLARGGRLQARRPWRTVVDALTATITGSAEALSHVGFAGRLVRLFCDQDDALVEMLLTNLRIFLNARPPVSHPAPRSSVRVAAVVRAECDTFLCMRDFGMKEWMATAASNLQWTCWNRSFCRRPA